MRLMTPDQCRMARAGLKLGVRELAAATNFSTQTVSRFEGGGDSRASTVNRLQEFLEAQGVIFIPADETAGPGVRLKSTGST